MSHLARGRRERCEHEKWCEQRTSAHAFQPQKKTSPREFGVAMPPSRGLVFVRGRLSHVDLIGRERTVAVPVSVDCDALPRLRGRARRIDHRSLVQLDVSTVVQVEIEWLERRDGPAELVSVAAVAAVPGSAVATIAVAVVVSVIVVVIAVVAVAVIPSVVTAVVVVVSIVAVAPIALIALITMGSLPLTVLLPLAVVVGTAVLVRFSQRERRDDQEGGCEGDGEMIAVEHDRVGPPNPLRGTRETSRQLE